MKKFLLKHKVATFLFGVWASMCLAGTGANSSQQTATQENLFTAMKGEAFAYVKYSLFAEEAERSGKPELAAIFRKAADTERNEHFAELARLYHLVGTNADNLRNAIQGENYEATTLYPNFSSQALAEGDTAAADRFAELAKDEAKHRDMFQRALNDLEAPKK